MTTDNGKPPKTTLMLILDAFRADYVTPEHTPFLAKLKGDSLSGGFVSPPGFAQRTTMFTGTYPDKSQNFSAFGYAPENSPFQWMKKLGPLRQLYTPHVWNVPMRTAVKHVTKAVTGNFHTDPAWIPGEFLPEFEVVEDTRPIFEDGALPFTSIFDLCRQTGKEFFYGAHPVSGDDDEIHGMLLERMRSRAPIDLYVAQFSAMDEGCHAHGPLLPPDWSRADDQTEGDVAKMTRALREIDRKVAELHAALTENYGDVNLLVLGDHGMAPVRRRVNVLKDLKSTGLKAGDDYAVFLDSTFAKLWFGNERAEREITELLASRDYGWILTEDERKTLRIDFQHRRYGDLMFAAGPGVLFWPDYFHIKERPIKGMHGYVDKREETVGALILNGPGVRTGDVGERILVDTFATLCELVDVPVTSANEGMSLLSDKPPLRPPEVSAPNVPPPA